MTLGSPVPARGTLYLVDRYKRAHIQQRPKILVLFGDNMRHVGLGGQAKECRGEPNVLGIPTKWAPLTKAPAFFHDNDYAKVAPIIAEPFRLARDTLLRGQDVAYPSSGVGTGLADLQRRAPKLYRLIQSWEGLLMQAAMQTIQVNRLSKATS